MSPMMQRQKSWMLALLLCTVVGVLGGHNFYLGYWRIGAGQLGLAALAVALFAFPSQVSFLVAGGMLIGVAYVWAFLEFMAIAIRWGRYGYDATGVPLARE